MFQGTMTALVTPFRDGKPDIEALGRMVDRQIEAGIHGLVACGTTGEAAAMTIEERLLVVKTVIERTAGRVPVIAGSGTNNTRATVETTKKMAELGVQGVLVVTPYYVKPTQAGLLRHYEEVAKVGVPVVAYNVPGRTGVSFQPETVERLAGIDNVVALKEATGDMKFTAELARRVPEGFSLLSGDDFTYLPFLACGGRGCISVVSNVDPKRAASLYDRFAAGNLDEARGVFFELLPLVQALFVESNPIPAKAAMHMLGLCEKEIRLPLTWLSEKHEPALRKILAGLGLLEDGK
ncbi:MAG: 4-hydroxy-tetrahydrodipicolinate synthase [Deltaproteobacteria bacterium]|nr:MAG: 4-hydroxy-tetrahydrodipicolinate synthase [Deltaproteobacteria bacterium]